MKLIKMVFRFLLGFAFVYAGVGHWTFARDKFALIVPTYLQLSDGFTDFIVLSSGLVEIALGLGLILWARQKEMLGVLVALFLILVFPGNIHQYVNEIDIPPLDTDRARLIRLFIQPVLVLWALWCTNGFVAIKQWMDSRRG